LRTLIDVILKGGLDTTTINGKNESLHVINERGLSFWDTNWLEIIINERDEHTDDLCISIAKYGDIMISLEVETLCYDV
jgi:hypothetical protein